MLKPIALILLCQLAGEAVAHGFGMPVPGPVIGLLLLFALLLATGSTGGGVLDAGSDGGLGGVADRILGMLGLLFVPAGVGLVDHLGLLSGNAMGFAAVLVVSVVVTLVVTVVTFVGVHRLTKGRGDA
ncbi:CidA/LrgA family protein [Aureimonas sp. OT7]|uniref:CidA/LrgA family protein n=1 Tax=Aureimonas sp. OT7 TaxID=2816454 RepID=UPI00177F9358|nr:CidA/LrgA family protein [Aureimonas sp. OT7]QOG06483.1 CidA/LrgA family protein [Aureimonas sp. OT7]